VVNRNSLSGYDEKSKRWSQVLGVLKRGFSPGAREDINMIVRLFVLLGLLLSGCGSHQDYSNQEFTEDNAWRVFNAVGDVKPEARRDRYLKILSREDLKPLEQFVAHSGLADVARELNDLDAAKDHVKKAIEIAKPHENELSGLMLMYYLQDHRYLYEIAELRKATEEARTEYQAMLDLFESRQAWKNDHSAEYQAVLVGLMKTAQNEEEHDHYVDKFISEVPYAQTTPFWIFQRYERLIIDDWENISPKIRSFLGQYTQYPYAVLLYQMLGDGHRRRGEYMEAIEMYEKGISHIEQPFKNLDEFSREYLVNSKMTKTTKRTMGVQCAECYIELGQWEPARRHLEKAIKEAETEEDKKYPMSVLSFIENNPPGTEVPRGRRGEKQFGGSVESTNVRE